MNEQDREVLRDIADQFRRIADAIEPVVKEWMTPRVILQPLPKEQDGTAVYVAVIAVIAAVFAAAWLLKWLLA